MKKILLAVSNFLLIPWLVFIPTGCLMGGAFPIPSDMGVWRDINTMTNAVNPILVTEIGQFVEDIGVLVSRDSSGNPVDNITVFPALESGWTWELDSSFISAGGGLDNVVEDLTPQLGGDLDVNSFDITSGTDILVAATTTATFAGFGSTQLGTSVSGSTTVVAPTDDNIDMDALEVTIGNGNASAGTLTILEDSNDGTDGVSLTTAALGASYTLTFPANNGDPSQVLTTDGSGILTWETVSGGGDSIEIDGVDVVDPDFVSTGDIDFVDTSNTVTANLNEDVVDPAHMANGDHGAFTYTSNVAALDANSVDSDQYVDGSIDLVHLSATGTASSSTFLRGDNTWATPAGGGGGLDNIVEDLTPQLGGDLDVNGNDIISVSNGNINILPNGTGNVSLGNFTFNADQAVGAGQDNYVFTYDDSSGLINLEVSASGADGSRQDPLTIYDVEAGGNIGVAADFDASTNGRVQRFLLNENATITFQNPESGGQLADYVLIFRQDGTGGNTVTLAGTSFFDPEDNAISDIGFIRTDAGVDTFVRAWTTDGGTKYYIEPWNHDVETMTLNTVQTVAARKTFSDGTTVSTDVLISPQANPTTDTDGQIMNDTDGWGTGFDALEFYNGTASAYIVATTASDTPSDGQVVTFNTGGILTWETVSGGGDSIEIDGVDVVDPDFVSTGDIDFVDTSNTITANINANSIVAGDIANGDHGDFTYASNVATLDTDSVSSNELNATGVEAELEAVMDLQDMQGAVTDGQLPAEVALIDDNVDWSGFHDFELGAVRVGLPGSNNYAVRLDYFNDSNKTDVSALFPVSDFGGLIRGGTSGHLVVGIEDNNVTDSFSITSGGGNWNSDQTFDTVVAKFDVDGDVKFGNYDFDSNQTVGAGQDNYVLKYDFSTGLIGLEAESGAAGGDSIEIDSSAVTDPDFVSTGDIDFVDTSNTVTANLNSAVVDFAHLNNNAITGATEDSGFSSGDFLLYSDTADSGNLKKVDYDDLPSGGGSGAFSDAGDPVVLNTTTKDVEIGSGTPSSAAKVNILGDDNQAQLVVTANATQTLAPFRVEQAGGATPLFQVFNNGDVMIPEIVLDDNGRGMLGFVESATATNRFDMLNADTGVSPTLRAVGGDTDVDLNLEAKGAGEVLINDGDLHVMEDAIIEGTITVNGSQSADDFFTTGKIKPARVSTSSASGVNTGTSTGADVTLVSTSGAALSLKYQEWDMDGFTTDFILPAGANENEVFIVRNTGATGDGRWDVDTTITASPGYALIAEWVDGAWSIYSTDPDSASNAIDASNVSITDAGGYYTGTDVEAVLQEVGSTLHTESETFTIAEPDVLQGITDDIVLKKFIAEKYPSGVTITSIHIDASAAYTSETFLFEHWDDAAGTTQVAVESIAASAISTEDDGTLSDATIPADFFFVLNFDDTPEDVAYVTVTISYTY